MHRWQDSEFFLAAPERRNGLLIRRIGEVAALRGELAILGTTRDGADKLVFTSDDLGPKISSRLDLPIQHLWVRCGNFRSHSRQTFATVRVELQPDADDREWYFELELEQDGGLGRIVRSEATGWGPASRNARTDLARTASY